MLAHEHLRIDLGGQKDADVVLGADDEDDVVADLREAKRAGLSLVTDLSVPGSGRDLAALARISRRAEVAVIAASGAYWDPFPDIVTEGSEAEIAELMVREIVDGDRGMRCGVIKVGTPRGAPNAAAGRLFEAAAAAALETGVAVVAHTSAVEQASWQIETLRRSRLEPERILISHFGKGTFEQLVEAGRSGVFLGIDQIGFRKGRPLEALAEFVVAACRAGLTRQLVLSSDIARRSRLRRHGGTSYGTVLTHFLPELRKAGASEQEIETMLRDNPARLLRLA